MIQVLLSALILVAALGAEIAVLFLGYPSAVPEVIVGRVLGTLDAVALMVLQYHYGSSAGSARKDALLSQRSSDPPAAGD